jgi:hypothetical protein
MKPTNLNWTPEREQREIVKLIEVLYDLLDGGKSFEELAV